MRLTLILFFCVAICSLDVIGQDGLSKVIDLSKPYSGVFSVGPVDDTSFLVSWYLPDTTVLGRDTVSDKHDHRYITHFVNDVPVKTVLSNAVLLKSFEKFYYLKDMYKIFRFNMNDQLTWKYETKRFYMYDVLVDKSGNTFVIEKDTTGGEGTLILKLDITGKLLASKKSRQKLNRLAMLGDKLHAYGPDQGSLFDVDLKEEVRDNNKENPLAYPVISGNFYYKAIDASQSNGPIFLQRYDAKSKEVVKKEIFQDARVGEYSFRYMTAMDLDARTIVVVRVVEKSMNILLVDKSSLQILKQIRIPCEKLRLVVDDNDIETIRVSGNHLIFAQQYTSYCKIGDLEFGDRNDKKKRGIAIVRQQLK